DPIEIEALIQAFETNKKQFCAVGSVKSNFGHLDTAAGIAGFVKGVLSLKSKRLFPSLHFKTPNPKIDMDNSPFFVPTESRQWKSTNGPLRAGISSFGIGGTNAHVILEEAPETVKTETVRADEPHLLLLSARTEDALERLTANLQNHLSEHPGLSLGDIAFTLQMGRRAFKYRRAIVSLNIKEAIESLGKSVPVSRRHRAMDKNRVIFMFPGLGGQYTNMALDLYNHYPVFRKELDRCFEIYRSLTGDNFKTLLYPDEVKGPSLDKSFSGSFTDRGQVSPIKPIGDGPLVAEGTEVVQPLIFSIEYALARLLLGWGIEPYAMIGYSFGEYAAAVVSGVFSLEDALKIIVRRGELVKQLPEGAMLSVPLTREELEPLVGTRSDRLSIAIDNGSACIVSGGLEAIRELEHEMKQQRLMCMRLQGVTHALHTPAMNPVLEEFKT
ncbi:MAG: type I polyketide synthase, partial [bacterium]|nr:type I polyketide synthase [bacterium]